MRWLRITPHLLVGMLAAIPIAALAQGGPALVEVTAVEQREVGSAQTFVGTVMPSKKSIVGSAVDGRVVEFPINEGDHVKAGETLAQLLTETISLELAASEAELELRKQELAELESGSRPEEIQQARARMDAAKARMEYTRLRLQRVQTLFRQGRAASTEEVDEATAAAEEAQNALLEATAAHELAVLGPRPEKIAQAQANVAMQQAVVDRLKDQIKKHTVISRFDGYVSAEHTEIGQWVARGDPVAEIVALDEVDVMANVVEDHVPFIHVGQSARIEASALAGKSFTGAVSLVVPQADPRSRTFPVKVRVANEFQDESPVLKAGMMTRVTLPTGPKQVGLLVPKDALVLGGPRPLLWVIDAKTIKPADTDPSFQQAEVQGVPVELGVADGDWIQVKGDGLAGRLVVSRGNERVFPPRPGKPSVVKWASPASSPAPTAKTR